MINRARNVFLFLVTAVVLSQSVFAQSAGAPRIYDVEFVNGVYVDKASVFVHSTCPPNGPQGVCGNGDSRSYSLNGKAGDQITISVVSDKKTAVFSIFYPDYTVVPKGSAVTTWTGNLPSDGTFRINVYTFKRSTPYRISIARTKNRKRM